MYHLIQAFKLCAEICQAFPFRLAALLDGDIALEDRRSIAKEFCSTSMCCLDAFSKRLREYMQARQSCFSIYDTLVQAKGFNEDDLTSPGGHLRQVVPCCA